MGRPCKESYRVSCNITKPAGQILESLFTRVLDRVCKPGSAQAIHVKNFVGRKPVGLALSILIWKTKPETWLEVVDHLKKNVKTERHYPRPKITPEERRKRQTERRLAKKEAIKDAKPFRISIAEEVRLKKQERETATPRSLPTDVAYGSRGHQTPNR